MTHSKTIASIVVLAASFVALEARAEGYGEGRPPEADSGPDSAAAAPFQLSLWSSAQIVNQRQAVHGFKLNLPYGRNRELRGMDFGIANHIDQRMYGLQLGLGGYVGGEVRGVQDNFIVSIAKGNVAGWQQGFYASAGSLQGAQTGFVTYSRGAVQGAQIAAVNVSGGYSRGAAIGVVNVSRRMNGLQLGLVNTTDELSGVQIGLVNVAKNGFLPFFPVMNAAL